MVKVCIERHLLPVADILVDIFTMRMAEIGIREDVGQTCRRMCDWFGKAEW